MTSHPTRRQMLAAVSAALTAPHLVAPRLARAASPPSVLAAETRTIEVKGRAANVFGLTGPDGRPGLTLDPGQRFLFRLHNRLAVPTIIHWHGQTPPPAQDGVTETGYAGPVAPGDVADYDFAARPGTHWMHSHLGLQEMQLLAAPLIVRSAEEAAADVQEAVLFLHDFSFKAPEELLAGLGTMDHGAMNHGAMNHGAMNHGGGMDLNDVEFDAYLANDRTLDDPEVVRVERGGRVRLRVINGAAATAFWLEVAGAPAMVLAVDGNAVVPVAAGRVPLAQGQRVDLLIEVPAGAVVPVFAQREGDRQRTGLILAAPGAAVARLDGMAAQAAPPADLSLDQGLARAGAGSALPEGAAQRLRLTGSMMPYRWTLDDRAWGEHRPLAAAAGTRMRLDFVNESMMAHPMHLHGHHFDVVAIDGRPVAGPRRDTVLVPAGATVGIAFDADNPGRWLLHCHNLLHMATGMMTEVRYG
ncbi:multicopper oxidase family protein [Zavarzinia compransoris]|nr:multicopper oxidase family protein [Zavarzinia compransoris]TDP43492.1 FtsP/CotA-like multicopper oxidase with cupredoxin domain [Zavarzinia compransoris]